MYSPLLQQLAKERVYEIKKLLEKGLARDTYYEASRECQNLRELLLINYEIANIKADD